MTRTPDCLVTRRAGCPPVTLACGVNPDPLVRPEPLRPGGRTIIGHEDVETGRMTWYGYDPYGELEAIAEGDEIWSGPDAGDDAF